MIFHSDWKSFKGLFLGASLRCSRGTALRASWGRRNLQILARNLNALASGKPPLACGGFLQGLESSSPHSGVFTLVCGCRIFTPPSSGSLNENGLKKLEPCQDSAKTRTTGEILCRAVRAFLKSKVVGVG